MDVKEQDFIKLWTWCGFKHGVPFPQLAKEHGERFLEEQYFIHDGIIKDAKPYCGRMPKLNLQNLYDYAIPKLQDKGYVIQLITKAHKGFIVNLVYPENKIKTVTASNPTEALYKAIMEVVNKDG